MTTLRGEGWRARFASSERMADVADASVQAVVCSPPYWDLKDYGHADQIGRGEPYARYHDRLDRVWRECHRALRDDGTMWVVVDKVMARGEVVPIPFHVAKRCAALGFTLQDLVLWNKPTAIAGMTPRSLVNKHETIVVLSKTKRPKLRADGLGDLWRVVVKAGSIRKTPDHEAPYPEELISQVLACATDPSDLVLDPFLGSGTTAKVAVGMGRRCVGYELNEAFKPLIEERMAVVTPPRPALALTDKAKRRDRRSAPR